VKKSDPMPAKTGLLRVKHLDMSIGTAPGTNRDRAFKVILKLIHEEFFGNKKPTHWDYVEFFANPRHFDLSCRETHCPNIIRKYGPPKRMVSDGDQD
jgi:hypothetical protein